MGNEVLWRQLTETDFNAMHGNASPGGAGGGARHISLGVRKNSFPIDDFLNTPGQGEVTINTAAQPGSHANGTLLFASIQQRRGGEWMIRDQANNRHPAWRLDAGFPTSYEVKNPPYIFIFRISDTFHVRFAKAKSLSQLPATDIPPGLLTDRTGIRSVTPAFLAYFHVPTITLLSALNDEAKSQIAVSFNPRNADDGRRRVLAEIVQRFGQPRFRRKLLRAYSTQCAVTRCKIEWVLEAAHITPYRGLHTNAISNGLLLRADIHTLFDLALLSIEPAKMKIRVSRQLLYSEYAAFEGRTPALPTEKSVQPSRLALEEHFSQFQP